MLTVRAPSLLALEDGDVRLELLPAVGGRIHRLTYRGRDVLRTPADPEVHAREPLFWGSYPLVPWSNRVPGGLLFFRDQSVRLPLNYPGHAIHGEAAAVPWTVHDGHRLVFRGGHGPFPWRYVAEQRFTVAGDTTRWSLTITNTDDGPMPAGLGFHPWFPVTEAASVRLPAASVYPSQDQVPIGGPVPVEGRTDLRHGPRIPIGIDEVWTDLFDRTITIDLPHIASRIELTSSASATHVVMAIPEELMALALEPVTHATDGHARLARRETGAIGVLEPNQTMSLDYALRLSPLSDP